MPHHQPKVKRVIYLFQSGDPLSTIFSTTSRGCMRVRQEVPKSVYPRTQDYHDIRSGSFPVAPTALKFKRHGASGIEWERPCPTLPRWRMTFA